MCRTDQFSFLLMRQLLDGFFPLHSPSPRRQSLDIGQPLRFVRSRISCALSAGVQPDAFVNVLSVARVVGSVPAEKDVDVKGQIEPTPLYLGLESSR